MPYRDLREYLQVLESKGLLCHVTAEVDKDWEISAVCRQTFRKIPQDLTAALIQAFEEIWRDERERAAYGFHLPFGEGSHRWSVRTVH